MAQGDGPAVWIDLFAIIREAESSDHGKHLGRKGFINFHDIHFIHCELPPPEQLLYGGDGSDPHEIRQYTSRGRTYNAGYGSQSETGSRIFRSDKHCA